MRNNFSSYQTSKTHKSSCSTGKREIFVSFHINLLYELANRDNDDYNVSLILILTSPSSKKFIITHCGSLQLFGISFTGTLAPTTGEITVKRLSVTGNITEVLKIENTTGTLAIPLMLLMLSKNEEEKTKFGNEETTSLLRVVVVTCWRANPFRLRLESSSFSDYEDVIQRLWNANCTYSHCCNVYKWLTDSCLTERVFINNYIKQRLKVGDNAEATRQGHM